MSVLSSSNPTLKEDTFTKARAAGEGIYSPHEQPPGGAMSINGTIWKALILGILVAFTFAWTWNMTAPDYEGQPLVLGTPYMISIAASIAGVIMSIVISLKPTIAPVLAPVFALCEGAFLGVVSAIFEFNYPGIVMQAMLATVAVFVSMLLLYRTGLIKVTDRFRAVVSMGMLAIFFIYLLSFVLSFFGAGVPYIHDASPIGIGFSVIVLIFASLMLLVDFDMIERGAAAGAPPYMEWYGAFALLVTIVWIYLEMLRLLAKLRD
jgi:uncharacterized YccA/Bax inhibitor family protein